MMPSTSQSTISSLRCATADLSEVMDRWAEVRWP